MSLWIGLRNAGRGGELVPYQMNCFSFGIDPFNPWELVPFEFKSAYYLAGFPLYSQYNFLFEVTFTSGSSDIQTLLTTANQAQDLGYLLGTQYSPPINFFKVSFKGRMFANL